jgi:signal transduction histidine kinase
MRRIIESLLFLTKADSGGLEPVRGKFEIAEFVRGLAEDGRAMADDRGVQFRLGPTDSGVMMGEETLLRQLMLNLMSNACRVVDAGGEVCLESRVEDGVWRVIVSDTGPGLPPDQLERIFERFVRFIPPGRAPDADDGHGLGLAICRSIVRLHGGCIRAENRSDVRGLRLIVELPIPPDSCL